MPLLLRALQPTPATSILGFRIVCSLPVLITIALVTGRDAAIVATLHDYRRLGILMLSSATIGANWLVYIYGVEIHRVVDVSLGYFIIPFMSAGVGAALLGEHLGRMALVAIALAVAALGLLLVAQHTLPLLSLVLAASFVLYAFIRKVAAVEPVEGMAVETLLLSPFAVAWLVARRAWVLPPVGPDLPMVAFACGAMAFPMLLFTLAVRSMRLSDLGFLQYLSPTLTLLIAFFVFGERIRATQLGAFGLIWLALGVYTYSRLRSPSAMSLD